MADKAQQIARVEREYAKNKAEFEKWKKDNEHLKGRESHTQYIESFKQWEITMLGVLQELRTSMARQPLAPEPMLPTVDLDTQLNEALRKVTQADFMAAVFAMAQKDPTFLPMVFQVVQRESQGTGFYNPIMSAGTSTLTPPQALLTLPPSVASYASPSSTPSTSTQPQLPYAMPARSYTQMTPVGAIPEGWVVDAAIRKTTKPPSPSRDYRKPPSIPFKDFSQM